MSTAGTLLHKFTIPTPSSGATGITSFAGLLWFTEDSTSKIGSITTAGVFTEYAIQAGSGPIRIAGGPDGCLYFAAATANYIGRITTAGAISQFTPITPSSTPKGIWTGPDGAVNLVLCGCCETLCVDVVH